MVLVHGCKEQADSGCDEHMHSLVKQLWREDAPYEQVVPQACYQNDVDGNWDGTHQRIAETPMTHCCRIPARKSRGAHSQAKHILIPSLFIFTNLHFELEN